MASTPTRLRLPDHDAVSWRPRYKVVIDDAGRQETRIKLLWIAAFVAVLAWSAIEPKDRSNWLLEVLPALLSGEGAEAFLGTQGYDWDTQSDMALALIGAICALVLRSHWHDRQIAQITDVQTRLKKTADN